MLLINYPKWHRELEHSGKVRALAASINPNLFSSLNAIAIMTTAAWANPHQLHPWFRMPTLKRKDLSDEEEDSPPPMYQSRRSLSPAPSPKRRRCDVLENGMSQLTLDGRSMGSAPYILASPIVQYPTDAPTSHPLPSWTDAPYAPRVTHIPTNVAATVVLPGSVEEPTSPETVAEETEVRDVSMKGPSWYEIEKDRTSASLPPSSSSVPPSSTPIFVPTSPARFSSHSPPSPAPSTRRPLFRHASRPPRPTVVDARSDDTGIVITDLEDSDDEDENTLPTPHTSTGDDGARDFTISSALLDRLPKHHVLGLHAPESNPSTALVLYRPLVLPGESSKEDTGASGAADDLPEKEREEAPGTANAMEELLQPMGEEVPMEDTRPCTPMVLESVDEPVDEPMDIEML